MLGWSVAGPKAFHCRLVKFYVDAAYEFLIMADMLSRAERSARMALIRSKDTKPELIVRKALWAAGYRYRLRVRGLPGRPDLVFPSLGVVVFVHGCFWHGHSCQNGRIPSTNPDFWREKFRANRERDQRNTAELKEMGWEPIVVWECSLSTIPKRERTLKRVMNSLEQARRTRASANA